LRQVGTDRFGLQEEAATGQFFRRGVEIDAFVDVVLAVGGQQLVEHAGGLAGVAGNFRHALLVVVEFFQRHDGQEDVVFFKAEQTAGVVHEHVGVEDENLGNGGLLCGCGLARHGVGLWLGWWEVKWF